MSEPRFYKYVVVGCGGIGSGALYWLARRCGSDVLGLEQFNLGHDHGGSQDHSRIIRLMYHDDRYTKLVRDTYKAWREVEEESGVKLVHVTGALQLAKKDGEGRRILQEYMNAMDRFKIDYEHLQAPVIRRRFPQFTVDDQTEAIYQKDGGLVDAAMSNSVHQQLAQGHGATIVENCSVTRVDKLADGRLLVHTTNGVYKCAKLIVTAGAWVNEVLGSLGAHIPLMVTQEQVTYMRTPHVKAFTKERFPIFIYVEDGRDFYGMASNGNSFSKIGIDAGGPPVTPSTRTYEPDPKREQECLKMLERNIPKAVGPIAYTKTCLYAMTRDRHFVVDTLHQNGLPQVIVCCGAGHAFKFASLLGKILSEMAVDGRTNYDISQFNIDRPAVTDPTFKTSHHMGEVTAAKAKI